MRRIIASLVVLLASLTPAVVSAQGFNPAGAPPWVFADNYGRWALIGQSPNDYTFSPANICQITQLNYQNRPTFFAFASNIALAPVFVQDQNGANSEVVTPGSAATQTAVSCAVNIAPVNSHTTFNLQSGTGGLQEAINAVGGPSKTSSGTGVTIVLSQEWYKLVNAISSVNATLANAVTPAGIIGTVTCSPTVQVLDVTTNPWTPYSCNPSTNLLAVSSLASKAPTIAAGAGAGGTPTVASVAAGSSATSGTVNITTGGTAPTASGTIFTLTFPSSTAGGYGYAPSCTYTSVGTNAYTTATATATAGPPATSVLTASSTALANTTAYKWTYLCH